MLLDAEVTAARLAEAQSGLVSYQDLLDAGMSSATISRRVRTGRLSRRRPGVYAFAGTPRLRQQELVAEALSVGPRAAVSHDSAAFAWGLLRSRPQEIHVVVRRWRREHRTTAVVHESLDFVPKDRVIHSGIPVTTPWRTVVDLGATSKWLVGGALRRGLQQDLFTIDDVAAFVKRVGRKGRRGVGVIRPLLELHAATNGSTESVLEDRFLMLLRERGLPLPEAQFEVRDQADRFVCRTDFAYPDARLLIELDGRAYHSDSESFQSDRTKQNRTQALGWTTLRFTWDDVTRQPDYSIAILHQTLRLLA